MMRTEQTTPQHTGRGYARKGATIVGAALLLWFVGVQGLAAVAARSGNPALLLLFDPGSHPDAGNKLAQIYLRNQRFDRALAIAKPTALAAPMDVRIVRTLGQALQAAEPAAAANVMRVAEKLSWRDTPTSLWVMRDAALHTDYPRVMAQLDALGRRQTEQATVQKLFHASIGDAPSRLAFATVLKDNPPWRGGFFADSRTNLPRESYPKMEALLTLLAGTKSPPSAAERMTFIDRMVDTGDAALARGYWLRSFGISSLARTQVPYDPSFQAVASRQKGVPVSAFEWNVGPDADQFIAFRRTDRGYVLDLNPAHDAAVPLLAQTLLLPPGTHRIDADIVQGSALQAPAEWQLTCSGSAAALIRSFATAGNELSGVNVTIPPEGCKAQTLTLMSNNQMSAQPVTMRSVSIR
jgi:hypothetical protein